MCPRHHIFARPAYIAEYWQTSAFRLRFGSRRGTPGEKVRESARAGDDHGR